MLGNDGILPKWKLDCIIFINARVPYYIIPMHESDFYFRQESVIFINTLNIRGENYLH